MNFLLMLAKCLAREIKEDTSNRVASDPWNFWKPLKTPQMVDTPEKVPEYHQNWDSPWKNLKKSPLKPAVRNNNTESQKNLVSKLIELLFIIGSYTFYRDVLESRQIGRAFKLVNPKHEDQESTIGKIRKVFLSKPKQTCVK